MEFKGCPGWVKYRYVELELSRTTLVSLSAVTTLNFMEEFGKNEESMVV